jgi:flagellar biosynthesis/type III secretory pathway protein FliH
MRRKITVAGEEEINSITVLMEADTMLAERIESWFEAATQKGVLLGKQEGRQEGRQEGESMLLHRLLTRRFGSLPDEIETRLAQASLEQLETWGGRARDAQ